jgi:hypothetical protein
MCLKKHVRSDLTSKNRLKTQDKMLLMFFSGKDIWGKRSMSVQHLSIFTCMIQETLQHSIAMLLIQYITNSTGKIHYRLQNLKLCSYRPKHT